MSFLVRSGDTVSTERMTILGTSGNVGIGTTSPGYILEVSNSTATTSTSFLGLTNPYVFGFNTGLNIGSSIVYSSRWQGDGVSGVVEMCKIDGRKEQNANFGDSYLAFQTRYVTDRVNGGAGTLTEKMRISGIGNVGIGTTSPGNTLQIGSPIGPIYGNNPLAQSNVIIFGNSPSNPTYAGTGTMGGTLFINSTNANALNVGASIALGGRGYDFGGGQQHMTFARIQGTQSVGGSAFYGDFVIETQSSGALYERMRINQNGYVGIGTTSPAALLTCAAAYTNGGTHAEETGAKILLGANNQSVPYGVAIQCRVPANSTVNESDMQFSTCDNSGNQIVRMTIKGTSNPTGGNVGIGTTNPSTYTLQVSGTIGATGDITAFFSDDRLKTKTGRLESALEKVLSLEAFTYVPNDLAKSFGFEDSKQRVGLSAQSVQRVLPEAVCPAPFDAENQSGQGYLTVQYDKLVPLLVEAIKELASRP